MYNSQLYIKNEGKKECFDIYNDTNRQFCGMIYIDN